MQDRISIAHRPPKCDSLIFQLREISIRECLGDRAFCRDGHVFSEINIFYLAMNASRNIGIRKINDVHHEGHGRKCVCGSYLADYERIFDNYVIYGIQMHVIPYSHFTPPDGRNPVPTNCGMERRVISA